MEVFHPSLIEIKELVQFLSNYPTNEAQDLAKHWEQYAIVYTKHITEINYPEQTKRFREILDEMYQVHLEKNADYSPMNILATGIVGIATRIWDKTARVCNLLGFNLQTGEYYSERKSTNDESIEDNLKDLGVYSIIGRIYREGKWGK